MKKTIINKPVSIIRVFALAIVFTILLPYNTIAQDDYQRPIQPQNYLYLPSFIEYGMGLDVYNNHHANTSVTGHSQQFDSTIAPPMEALSQRFMIDSTITIYGIAIFRYMSDDGSLSADSLESWTFEDSLQIRSLDHDTIYRSVCIAHSSKPKFLNGVFEYYFDSLTISTPFTVVKTFSRDYYRKHAFFPSNILATYSSSFNDEECHSFQRPSFKHYGDSLWYDMRECHIHALVFIVLWIFLLIRYTQICLSCQSTKK